MCKKQGTTYNSLLASGSRVYSWRYWHDGALVADIWPSLGPDGETPCFHDNVRDVYIYNIGSGTPTYAIDAARFL